MFLFSRIYLPATFALVALPFLAQASSKTGLSMPIAKRFSLRGADGIVDITKLHGSRHHAVAKFKRGLDAFERNTGRPHDLGLKLRHSNSKRRIKTYNLHRQVAAGIENLTYTPGLWSGSITVGTPGQAFTVQLDTGSSDLFIPGVDCDSTCDGHNRYDPSLSSTTQYVGGSVNLDYGGGTVSSATSVNRYNDTVTFAGYTATEQMFGSAVNMSGFNVSSFAADGILGMGFQSLSQLKTPPVIQSLVAQGVVPNAIFGLYMADSNNSELFLGGVNEELYTGEITYVSIEQKGYWQFSIDEIVVNGQSLVGTISTIIDTGTSINCCDNVTVKGIFDNIPGSVAKGDGTYTFPCDTNVTMSVNIGSTTFNISSDTLSLGPETAGSDRCVGSMTVDDTLGFCIMGDPFLRNVYTVFDLENNRVGFASLPSTV